MDGAALYTDNTLYFFLIYQRKTCYVRIIYFVNTRSWLFFVSMFFGDGFFFAMRMACYCKHVFALFMLGRQATA